tara:strand:- start:8274 stop:8621 length:348 start_codon:yes stop_codon:yes gene_type:complete
MKRGRHSKNTVYRFSLAHGRDDYVFGAGTLEEGAKLVRKIDLEFERKFDTEPDSFFTLPFPFHKVPIYAMEGADITAWNEEEGELLFFGFYYDKETEEYIPMDEDEKDYTAKYWC